MRIVIAGTHSGCGKTTVSLAIMAALTGRGLRVAPFKAGPDYIDAAFHREACGMASDALDMHLCDVDVVRTIAARGEARADMAVVEGVMGYYDGMDARSFHCSTHELAKVIDAPVILVVDASGGAASVAAMVKGFAAFTPDSGIAAALVNRVVSRSHYEMVRDAIQHHVGLPCVGYMVKDKGISLLSRHLGLITARETAGLAGMIQKIAASAVDTVDLDMVARLADRPAIHAENADDRLTDMRGCRLGVALDDAFQFYYPENLRMLEASGVELAYFSPMNDERLPDGLTGLYIGGGYPEVFANRLEDNASMRDGVLAALNAGMRCYAECGGLLYLSRMLDGRRMAGFFPIDCAMTDRLRRFGYVNVKPVDYNNDSDDETIPAHEFHYAKAEPLEDVPTVFHVVKASRPDQSWRCGYTKLNTIAGFPHLHFGSHPQLIRYLWGRRDRGE